MKDFIQIYKRKNFVHNLSIVGVSLILALGIHFSMGGTQYGKYIKSSVIDATQSSNNSGDVYLKLNNNGDSVALKSGKNLVGVTKLAFSLSFDAEGVKVNSIVPVDSQITGQNIANTPGYQTVFLIFSTPRDIQADQTLATLEIEKLSQKIQYINLFSVNTEDINKNLTELSSSGIDF